jgi:two-component system cell cycle response regulator CtrA
MTTTTPTHLEAILHLGPIAIDLDRMIVQIHNSTVRLPPGEKRILAMLIRRKGEVCRPAALWRFAITTDREPSDISATVKVHVSRLRARLRAAGAPDMIGTVWGVGYIARDPDARARPNHGAVHGAQAEG